MERRCEGRMIVPVSDTETRSDRRSGARGDIIEGNEEIAMVDESPVRKHLDKPVTEVRRKDRAFAEAEWIGWLLATAAVGQFAIAWEGQPLIHSSLFWYDGAGIYWHTAAAGKLSAVLDRGAQRACFTVAELGRILPAATPFAFSAEYASVVCYGTARIVRDGAEKRRALEGIMAKYAPQLAPGVDYAPMPDRDIAVPNVYRLAIDARIGKHNVKPPDQPGFAYPCASFIDAERAAGRMTIQPGPHLTAAIEKPADRRTTQG
jgi:nitroimidazol reductase NimA-like FMN-containing flavoprotein (pyridoxamine 5'-phosphate oxidase superfamily)